MRSLTFPFAVWLLAAALLAGCGVTSKTNINYYDFGQTLASAEHGEMSTPEVTDGPDGREIWAGYGWVRYQADSGRTVESAYPSFGFRQRLARFSDFGLGLAWTQNNHYLAADLKFVPIRGWLTAGLDLYGQFYQSKDKGDGAVFGLALPLGTALATDRLGFYVSPRFSRSSNLVYMVETITYSGLRTDTDQDRTYAYTNTWGLASGMVWSIPWKKSYVKLRPEVSYSAGRETKYNNVVYQILLYSLKLHYVF